jgi:hypothetical protein
MIRVDNERIAELLVHPAESLNVEVKTWIDPRTPDGIAKLIKAVFAIRNRNGGFVVLGFDNLTLKPDPNPLTDDIDLLFHIDEIQGLVSRFASQPF